LTTTTSVSGPHQAIAQVCRLGVDLYVAPEVDRRRVVTELLVTGRAGEVW
jgi:hypothetical protein